MKAALAVAVAVDPPLGQQTTLTPTPTTNVVVVVLVMKRSGVTRSQKVIHLQVQVARAATMMDEIATVPPEVAVTVAVAAVVQRVAVVAVLASRMHLENCPVDDGVAEIVPK